MSIRSTRTVALGVMILASAFISPSAARAQTGQVPTLADEAVALFGKYCLQAPPNFDSINQRATNSGYEIFQNRLITSKIRQKEWLVPVSPKDPPLLLITIGSPSRNSSVAATGCGVSALGAPGPALRQVLSDDPRLGHPTKVVSPAPDGGTEVFWSVRYSGAHEAGEAQVMLTYGVPGLGVNPINLIFKRSR